MRDIADITQDIRDQTRLQGEKMDVIDEELHGAADNVEAANEQLHQKMERENTGNKCLVWCVVIAVIVLVLLIFFGFVRQDTVTIEVQDLANDPAVADAASAAVAGDSAAEIVPDAAASASSAPQSL